MLANIEIEFAVFTNASILRGHFTENRIFIYIFSEAIH